MDSGGEWFEIMANPTAAVVFQRLYHACQTIPELWEVIEALNAVDASHTEDWDVEISFDDQNELLRSLTGFIVRLNLTVSCYPVGLVTTIFFDEDGNPV